MGDSFDEQFQRTMRNAAMARRNAEMTYYLDASRTQFCMDGERYSTYLVHRGTKACHLKGAVHRVGMYSTLALGVQAARSMQPTAMPCPACLDEGLDKKFSQAVLRSRKAPDQDFKHYVLGGALIRYREKKINLYMLHLCDCPHYVRKGAVDFGFRLSLTDFSDAVAAKYPGEVEYANMQLCYHCFPEELARLYRKGGMEPPKQVHYLRQALPNGRYLCHRYECPVCPNDAEDLGWTVNAEHAVSQLDFYNAGTKTDRCTKCMSEEEFHEIKKEFGGQLVRSLMKGPKK
jgi:hypothetical protein